MRNTTGELQDGTPYKINITIRANNVYASLSTYYKGGWHYQSNVSNSMEDGYRAAIENLSKKTADEWGITLLSETIAA